MKTILSCPSCQLARINGMICHETGCPDSHLYTRRSCDWCGSEFEPSFRDEHFCDDSCRRSYLGLSEDDSIDRVE